MNLSIRGRLTAIYAGALFVALAVCALGLYSTVRRLEIWSVDDELTRAASTTAFSMNAEIVEGLNLHAAAKDTGSELRIPGIAVGIFDPDAHLLSARWEGFDPGRLKPEDLSPGTTIVRAERGRWRVLVTNQTYNGMPYIIVNAIPLSMVDEHGTLLRTAFLTIMPMMALLAVGGGWFLSR